MQTVYVVDRMVLSSPKFERVRRERKRLQTHPEIDYLIIDEVAYESRSASDYEIIKKEASDEVTPDHLEKLKEITPALISRGILSWDEGNGDAMLAMECMIDDELTLLEPPDRVLVTEDKKLSEYCRNNHVAVIDPARFFQLTYDAIDRLDA